MGMHFGLIAATSSMDAFMEELGRHAVGLATGADIGSFASGEPDAWELNADPDGFELAVGERGGRTYLLDTSLLLSDSPDVVVAMSQRLGLVVGGGAETVSGAWWLTVARDGELLRYVWVQNETMTQGMTIGDPLPTESEYPIVDLEGAGLFAVLEHFGFDWETWRTQGTATALTYDMSRVPVDGQVEHLRAEHMARYAPPPRRRWASRITVVTRTDGSRGGMAPARGRGWWRRARKPQA